MAPISEAQVAALRALLQHDAEGIVPSAIRLGETGMSGYQYLAEAALTIAARRWFAPKYTSADLIRFVSTVRTSRLADGDEFDFDPLLAEKVLRQVVGQDVDQTPNSVARFRAIIALLSALADIEFTNAADIDSLLDQARNVADRWLTLPFTWR